MKECTQPSLWMRWETGGKLWVHHHLPGQLGWWRTGRAPQRCLLQKPGFHFIILARYRQQMIPLKAQMSWFLGTADYMLSFMPSRLGTQSRTLILIYSKQQKSLAFCQISSQPSYTHHFLGHKHFPYFLPCSTNSSFIAPSKNIVNLQSKLRNLKNSSSWGHGVLAQGAPCSVSHHTLFLHSNGDPLLQQFS